MELNRAREIIRSLAEGTDPTTGEVLAGESVYNKPDVIRALYTILEETTPKPAQPLDPYRNAGKPWTDLEDDKLRDEFAEKMKIADIAKKHGRTYGAMERRLDHLELKNILVVWAEIKNGRFPYGNRPTQISYHIGYLLVHTQFLQLFVSFLMKHPILKRRQTGVIIKNTKKE